MTDPLTLIEQRLHANGNTVKRSGDRLQATCPTHDDTNPSLTVMRGTTQPVVIHCHAGCDTTRILEALHLTWADISNERETPAPTPPANYLYTDANGTPLFRVVRGENKRFMQQHLTPQGEWVNGRGGIEPVLYNLPNVLAAVTNGEPVYIVEGEKDCDTLNQWGVTATTNPGGAGNFTPLMADTLHDANVVIIADNDPAGHAHAHDIAALLTERQIRHQTRLTVHGKDVSEQHGQGYDPLETQPLTETPADDLAHLIDWSTFWAQTHDDEEWVAWPLIPKGRTVSLFAPAKAGKSTVLLACIAAACTGQQPLNNRETTQQPVSVLYLDYEMSSADLWERLTELGYNEHTDLQNLHYALLPSLPALDTAEGGQYLYNLAKRLHVDAVVVDTIGRAIEGEENSADTIRAFYRHTAQPLKAAGISVLRTDHAGKNADKGQRGTSAKNDDVDIVYRLQRNQKGVTLNRTHSRITWAPNAVDIDYEENNDGTVTIQLAVTPVFPDGTAQIAEIMDELEIPLDLSIRKTQDIMREHGHPVRQEKIRHAMKMRRQQHLRDPFA